MRYLIFGTGNYYNRYKKWFLKEDIVALLDNSPEKQGTYIDGIKVLTPCEAINLDYDAVVILSFFVMEMRKQLYDIGVPKEKIYHFYDLHYLLGDSKGKREICYYGNAEQIIFNASKERKKILLMSQDLELTGPAIALFQVSLILKSNGFDVVYISMLDGDLRSRLIANNIPIVVDINLQIETMCESAWNEKFNLIICNTINFHIFLMDKNKNIPIIWWLHDPKFFYAGIRKDNLKKIDFANVDVYSVGPMPERAIHEYLPDLKIGRLLYGVEDVCNTDLFINRGEKICFTTIGYINSIKGQDILFQAIMKLPENLRKKCVFRFVGQNTSNMAQQMIAKSDDIVEVEFLGIVDRDGINKILSETDMLICPSRDDAMPTVCAEAMMHSVPCLVSDVVGTAEYIEDGVSGLIFESENVEELSKKIQWSIENIDKIYEMKNNARKIYEDYFSMSVFEKNLLEIVGKTMPSLQ